MAGAHCHCPVWMTLYPALVETVHMTLKATHAIVIVTCMFVTLPLVYTCIFALKQ